MSPTHLGGICSDATRYGGESWVAPISMETHHRHHRIVEGCYGLPSHVKHAWEILYAYREPIKGNDHTDTVVTSLCPSSVVKADLE